MDTDALIVVIDGSAERGERLKESLEFMDVQRVEVANAENWRERLGERRLAAIFVGDDLDPAVLRALVRDVGEYDPNTPIVRVRSDDTAGLDEES